MASSVAAVMQPTYIVRYKSDNGKTILGFLAVFRDYYNYYGIPMFYYVVDEDDHFKEAKYILVKLDESGERVEPSRTTKPGYIAIPIINISSAARFLLPKDLD
ncbi:MAG TPA: cren protein [Ignisphaera sp.]|nr:cren protein [Ignisphaera sp.]